MGAHFNNKGVALILTLWVLVLLSVIALNMASHARTESAVARNYKEQTRMRYMALSAHEDALAYIMSDPDQSVDFVDESGHFRTDAERAAFEARKEDENGWAEAVINDEESKLNVNLINRTYMHNLCAVLGTAEDEDVDVMLDSLYDWIDPDDVHHSEGAEEEYYLPLGYKPKNRTLNIPEELIAIKGFKVDMLLGTEEAPALIDFLTTYTKDFNINTASVEALQAYGLSTLQTDAIISSRESLSGLRSVPAAFKSPAITYSNVFKVVSRASLNDSHVVYKITSVFKRNMTDEEAPIVYLYWREELETGGV